MLQLGCSKGRLAEKRVLAACLLRQQGPTARIQAQVTDCNRGQQPAPHGVSCVGRGEADNLEISKGYWRWKEEHGTEHLPARPAAGPAPAAAAPPLVCALPGQPQPAPGSWPPVSAHGAGGCLAAAGSRVPEHCTGLSLASHWGAWG